MKSGINNMGDDDKAHRTHHGSSVNMNSNPEGLFAVGNSNRQIPLLPLSLSQPVHLATLLELQKQNETNLNSNLNNKNNINYNTNNMGQNNINWNWNSNTNQNQNQKQMEKQKEKQKQAVLLPSVQHIPNISTVSTLPNVSSISNLSNLLNVGKINNQSIMNSRITENRNNIPTGAIENNSVVNVNHHVLQSLALQLRILQSSNTNTNTNININNGAVPNCNIGASIEQSVARTAQAKSQVPTRILGEEALPIQRELMHAQSGFGCQSSCPTFMTRTDSTIPRTTANPNNDHGKLNKLKLNLHLPTNDYNINSNAHSNSRKIDITDITDINTASPSNINISSPFGHPNNFQDARWKWRLELQNFKTSQISQRYVYKLLCDKQQICLSKKNAKIVNKAKTGSRKQLTLSKTNSNSNSNSNSNCNSRNGIDCETNVQIMSVISQRCLKFGCPKHDLVDALLKNGYKISHSKHILCNFFSPNCCLDKSAVNINDKRLVELDRWSFLDLDIRYTGNAAIDAPLSISFNNMDNININNHLGTDFGFDFDFDLQDRIHVLFDILRTDEAAFVKRFRPGIYKYNGTKQRKKSQFESKQHVQNSNGNTNDVNKVKSDNGNAHLYTNASNCKTRFRWTTKENQMGTWVCRSLITTNEASTCLQLCLNFA